MFQGKGLCFTMPQEGEIRTPHQCMQMLEEVRSDLLDRWYRFEEHFVQMKWEYWKFREVVYFPLWQAKMMKENEYSSEKAVEGELLFARYRHFADVYLEEAEIETKDMLSAFEDVKDQIGRMGTVCAAWDYQDCLGYWRDKLRLWFDDFEALIQRYVKEEKSFAVEIENTVQENASEHHDFAERYHEKMTTWNYQYYPEVLRKIRELREELEFTWPADKCCESCTMGNVSNAMDPLFGDRERSRVSERQGIGGDVVSKNNLVRAMDEIKSIGEKTGRSSEQDEYESQPEVI